MFYFMCFLLLFIFLVFWTALLELHYPSGLAAATVVIRQLLRADADSTESMLAWKKLTIAKAAIMVNVKAIAQTNSSNFCTGYALQHWYIYDAAFSSSLLLLQ